MNSSDIPDGLKQLLNSDTTEYDSIIDAMIAFASTRERLQVLAFHCSKHPQPDTILALNYCLYRYQTERGFAEGMLDMWLQMVPAVQQTWTSKPEMILTALNGIESEIRAEAAGMEEVLRKEASALSSLLCECLADVNLPRLRDLVFASAIHLIYLLFLDGRLEVVFDKAERRRLSAYIGIALDWFRNQPYGYSDEIQEAVELVTFMEQ